MAINLNPGADATLVNAAYKAAASTAPKDYSRTLERAADSYEKTMQAQSQTLGSIAALGTAIGGEMVANANELSAMAAEGAGLDAEGAKVLIEELYANKDAQKELRGINFLQSRETRQKKQELKLEQRELFANIKNATESIKLGSEAVAAGTFKVLRGNEVEAEMVNAIIKSNLKDKATGNKNIARLGRDEKTGELMYTMYNAESDPNGVSYDPPRTMTIRQFNKAITTNVDDKGVMKGKLDTINDVAAKAGNTSLNGTYHSEMKQMHLNQLDDIVKTDTDLQRAFGEKFGYSNSSFTEDMQRPSNLSMWVYNDLLSVTGSKDGVLADSELTKGIIDIDGEAGISQEDLQDATNYGILSANILGLRDPEVSKALFKEYTIDKLEAAHKFGYGQKPPVAGKTDGTETKTDTNPYGLSLSKKGKYGLGLPSKGTSYVPQYDAGYVANKIDNLKSGTEITFQGSNYTFREVNGETQWWRDYGKGENYDDPDVEGVGIGTVIGSAQDMAKNVFRVDDPIFTSIVTEREEQVPDDVTGLLPSENPFADKQATAEGQPKPRTVPNDFVTAFGKDFASDNAVVKYLKGMNVAGLVVGNYQGGGDLDYPDNDNRKLVEPISAYDDIIITLNGKTKLFTTDPSFSDDTKGAQEIWNWLHENFSGENVKSSNYSGSAADIVAEIN